MQLTVRQAAVYFGVDDQTVRRWIADRDLPVHRANERFHLNAIEVSFPGQAAVPAHNYDPNLNINVGGQQVWNFSTADEIILSRPVMDELQKQDKFAANSLVNVAGTRFR